MTRWGTLSPKYSNQLPYWSQMSPPTIQNELRDHRLRLWKPATYDALTAEFSKAGQLRHAVAKIVRTFLMEDSKVAARSEPWQKRPMAFTPEFGTRSKVYPSKIILPRIRSASLWVIVLVFKKTSNSLCSFLAAVSVAYKYMPLGEGSSVNLQPKVLNCLQAQKYKCPCHTIICPCGPLLSHWNQHLGQPW